ncbi:MAG: DUF1156 domain-containing protein [Bryobacterales bacterium]|nr:DUF1156 domain-containing protein [Bryobacterales bacterium]
MTRLSETTIPLRQISLDSVHEKNVRHGHVSTLHVWPARRPLAAARSMLLATLLPDPGDAKERRRLGERMAGRLVPKKLKGGGEDVHMKETTGGVLHWGREDPLELERFRIRIREAFGGRAPRVLDPFAGGGAIPLEAMRLGCETFAADLNPVAWFVLRCTLHYPHLVRRIERALPDFAITDRDFALALVKARLKSRGVNPTPARIRNALADLGHHHGGVVQVTTALADDVPASANFAWHLRAWGLRVRDRVGRILAAKYPVYAYFEPRQRKGRKRRPVGPPVRFRPRDPTLLRPDSEGRVTVEPLNERYEHDYLEDDRNPRWIAKPVVACLWARTAECGGCRAEIPLLKTRWLCKKSDPVKRVLLTMSVASESCRIDFNIRADVPVSAGSVASKRAQDQELGKGTMSRSGAACPCCGAVTKMKELRAQGRSGRLGSRMIAVVIDGQKGKEYRLPTDEDLAAARVDADEIAAVHGAIPFGLPDEPMPDENALGMRVRRYGFDTWGTLFTDRQLLALGTFLREIRHVRDEISEHGYPEEWREALTAYLACTLSKLADYSSSICSWHNSGEKLGHTYARFALPMVWDFCEVNPLSATTGGFMAMLEWVARYLDRALVAVEASTPPDIAARSALAPQPASLDLVCTDPPYYDAIPYSDLMDFFQVWLRRALQGVSPEIDEVFADPLGPKWQTNDGDGELIDDASRFGGDQEASKKNYEDGMARAFARCHEALRDDGRLVVVFANKDPDAWETVVAALIRSGFMATGSWPIQTEMQTRQRAMASAALASSIWLICRKRTATRPGWEPIVLREMREKIIGKLRDFWDAGIRGPDFVWSATGPALEAFSKYPVVKRGVGERVMQVGEFLASVRRIVVSFVVGRLFSRSDGTVDDLDELTTYYLLHRHDFGMDWAPAGAVILYALSCNFRDADLVGRHDLLVRGKAKPASEPVDDEPGSIGSDGDSRLKRWNQRKVGSSRVNGGTAPLIDSLHAAMRLWTLGDLSRVNGFLDARGLRKSEVFASVVQAVLEMATPGSGERSTLEKLQNHLGRSTPPDRVRESTLWDFPS